LEGLVRPHGRGYYRCRACHDSVAVADEILGSGPGALTPGLGRIGALNAASDRCGQAVQMLG